MFDLRSGRRRTATSIAPDEPAAVDHLQVSRQTMERSSTSTAVSGWGLCAVGATALIAAAVAMRQRTVDGWLAVWLAEALVAFTIGLFSMQRKASRQGADLLSTVGRRLLMGMLPALAAGGVLTAAIVWDGSTRLIPGVWLLLYGIGVVQAGAFSVRAVPAMGAGFVVLGALALPMPWMWANIMLAAGFGVAHIAFGAFIASRHGG
jgi:hypothetical protein